MALQTMWTGVRADGTGDGGSQEFADYEALARWVGGCFSAGWQKLTVTVDGSDEVLAEIFRDPDTGRRTSWSCVEARQPGDGPELIIFGEGHRPASIEE